MEELNKEAIMKFFADENNFEECYQLVAELNGYDNSLANINYYYNDEEFFAMVYGTNVMDAVRDVCFGDYRYNDDYVRLNAVGHLESACKYEVMAAYDLYKDEIADCILAMAEEWGGLILPEEFYVF